MTWLDGLRTRLEDAGVTPVVRAVLDVVDVPVLVYFVVINTSYLVLITLAALEFARHLRRVPFAGLEPEPVTAQLAVEVPVVEPVRATVKVKGVEPELPSSFVRVVVVNAS